MNLNESEEGEYQSQTKIQTHKSSTHNVLYVPNAHARYASLQHTSLQKSLMWESSCKICKVHEEKPNADDENVPNGF